MNREHRLDHTLLSWLWLAMGAATALTACAEDEGYPVSYYACLPGSEDQLPAHPRAQEFQASVEEATRHGLPGVMVLIRDQSGTWIGAAGCADLASDVPMLPCHRTHVASITKVFVATTALMLVEEGVLDLDAPITQYLPASIGDHITNGDRISLRQLLNHRSGIFDYSAEFEFSKKDDPKRVWPIDECLAAGYDKPASFEPGQGYQYSNTNYLLIGEILESVTGEPLEDQLQARILDPLQLNGTSYQRDGHVAEGVIRGYYDLHGNDTLMDVTDTFSVDCVGADGGAISTAGDLGRFIDALMRDQSLLSPPIMEAMLDTFVIDDSWSRGLGISVWKSDHGAGWGHGGHIFGYLSEMRYFPEHELTFVMLANSSGTPSDPFGDELLRILDDVL